MAYKEVLSLRVNFFSIIIYHLPIFLNNMLNTALLICLSCLAMHLAMKISPVGMNNSFLTLIKYGK